MGPDTTIDDDELKSERAGTYRWSGEKNGFPMWLKLIVNKCKRKKGLVRAIVIDDLKLQDHLLTGGTQEDYEDANGWIYNLIGKPLLNNTSTTAYTLFNGQPTGEGIEILKDFKIFFAGETAEELEDLEDEWKRLSFQTEGVTNLAIYCGKHKEIVDRLNQLPGATIPLCKVFRRILKQLPNQVINILSYDKL